MAKHKDLYGYEGLYKISTNGDILKQNGNVVLTHTSKNGYLIANLTKNKKVKTEYVHRLVALTFIQNELQLKTVNHIDGNKKNNNISNLEWLSLADNLRHAFKIGIKDCNHSKLQLICTKTNKSYLGIKDACYDFGYSYSHLSKMICGERFNTTSLIRI